MDTHIQPLPDDLAQVSVLIDDAGQRPAPLFGGAIRWENTSAMAFLSSHTRPVEEVARRHPGKPAAASS